LTDVKYVSLFDLYFKYSSPIPARHPFYEDFYIQQNETFDMNDEYKGYQGFVMINDENINPIYVTKPKERVLFFNKDLPKRMEQEYDWVWNHLYYRKYLAKD
jgi:hypothetical protein